MLQLKMWLLQCNFWQKLQALNYRLKVLNKGSLRLSYSVTSTELILFVVGFSNLQWLVSFGALFGLVRPAGIVWGRCFS